MENIPLDDMSHIIGIRDNTVIRSMVGKLISIKKEMYDIPKVLFKDIGECYRVTLIWEDLVAFTYSEDINPVVEMLGDRVNDFSFTSVCDETKVSTVFSLDMIKEAQLHAVPRMSKRKRKTFPHSSGESKTKLPTLERFTKEAGIPANFFKTTTAKSNRIRSNDSLSE